MNKGQWNLLTAELDELLPDWIVHESGPSGYDLESWSPAGENVVISLSGESLRELADDARRALDGFDAEKHAVEIFNAKRSFDAEALRLYASAPGSLRDLLADAEAIRAMYAAVVDALEKEA